MSTSLIIGIVIFFAVLIGGAVTLVIIANSNPRDRSDDMLQDRLAELTETDETLTLEELEMSQPFRDRILIPLAEKVGDFLSKFTPQNVLEDTKLKLEHAGMGASLDPSMLLASRFVVMVLLGGLFIVLFTIGFKNMSIVMKIILVIVGAVLGFFLPQLLVQSKIDRRQQDIVKALPDALDLLTVCVEAGLGFDAAMGKVAEKWETDLSLEFARVNREIQLGKARREALRSMADRLGVADLTSFIAAVIQTEQLGVSLSKVLRIQADQMRVRRRQRAEQQAHKAPLKMLIPMTLLIFPTLIIVLVTPAIFMIFNSGALNAF
jgi:tight adherence protein C